MGYAGRLPLEFKTLFYMETATTNEMARKPMKTPITYYGGKQNMLKNILPLIPEHNLYCEPFCGGAAVFFSKPPSQIEVINDTNSELINFYEVVQQDFVSLEMEIRISLHSRRLHKDAQVVYESPHLFSRIKRAWAVWVLSVMSFSSMLDGSFGYDKSKNTSTKKVTNKRDSFSEDFAIRLNNVQIECTDALRVIRSRDSISSFFYCDPPYVGTSCGHYDGYTQEDFDMLMNTLSKIEGKFLMSSYPNASLSRFVKEHGWYQRFFETTVSVSSTKRHEKRKIEVLTSNYPI